jgi:quercetin dioxygenase-like cupin family protein
MSRLAYPHTIDDGAGERLTFLRRVPGARGPRLEGENRVAPGAGPPMHVHHFQDEGLTVVAGRLAHQRPGEAPSYAGPGETVIFRAGEAHRFWNAGDDVLHCTAWVEPADNLEFFLGELFASRRRNGGRRPDAFDAAFLAHRYRAEFTLVAMPALVRRVALPLVVAVGTLLGRYRRYADAPAPVRRRA